MLVKLPVEYFSDATQMLLKFYLLGWKLSHVVFRTVS